VDSGEVGIDKSLSSELNHAYGHISIRVVVLQKSAKNSPVTITPEGGEEKETLVDEGNTPVSSYLEEPKHGRQCAVFLVNGQRQHGWDNTFIQRDLEFKYLRNRMIVIVDVDGLKQEVISRLMQGSRQQFYEGEVYETLRSRVIATLKADPDLNRLEAEAEEEIYELKSGDEAVKKTLDRLIEEHSNKSVRKTEGASESGNKSDENVGGALDSSEKVVVEGYPEEGEKGNEPVLILIPDIYTIRLRPDDTKRLTLTSQPLSEWRNFESLDLKVEPAIKELSVIHNSLSQGMTIDLKYNEPENWDKDEYPIEVTLRILAKFSGKDIPRMVERRVIISPPVKHPPKPPPILLDEPTYLKVSSRQPINFYEGGPDVHVKLQWDGKDYLAAGENPIWLFEAKCTSEGVSPAMTFSKPKDGKMELLIQVPNGLFAGDKIGFEVVAIGPNSKLLLTTFNGDVIRPPEPRKIDAIVKTGGQRRPLYELRFINKEHYQDETCWDATQWTENDPGCFQEPTPTALLTLIINEDMNELESYREKLIEKQLAESTVEERKTKYVSHIGFHLYQMYKSSKEEGKNGEGNGNELKPEDMRKEIRRVAVTLLKLMET
jgi:hypothetical protein